MIRQIIQIDEDLCNGCGACASACHEGAIAIVNGKAKLMRDDYCDGLGNCLPVCPTGAISFMEREAAAYDEQAVKAKQTQPEPAPAERKPAVSCSCPGTRSRNIARTEQPSGEAAARAAADAPLSRLTQWPVQIKLAPVNAPFFNRAKLLVAADCTAYARGDFHERFIKNH
ncbi:MAG: 4Fe-4S binding protein, partial [Eubacteriales bacterium]